MYEVNVAKYGQNPAMRATLLSTGNRTLVEASPNDKIWGIGMTVNEMTMLGHDRTKWRGQNLLGFILEKVRDLYQNIEAAYTSVNDTHKTYTYKHNPFHRLITCAVIHKDHTTIEMDISTFVMKWEGGKPPSNHAQ